MEFVAFTFWGLVLTVAFLVVASVSTRRNEPEFVAVAIFILSGVLYFFNGINVITILWDNLTAVLFAVPGWLLAGAGWSVFMWDRFCAAAREKYDMRVSSGGKPNFRDFMPLALDNKRSFFTWILLWPFSMIGYVFGDMLRDAAEAIMRRLNTVYSAIAHRHFRDVMPPRAGE